MIRRAERLTPASCALPNKVDSSLLEVLRKRWIRTNAALSKAGQVTAHLHRWSELFEVQSRRVSAGRRCRRRVSADNANVAWRQPEAKKRLFKPT